MLRLFLKTIYFVTNLQEAKSLAIILYANFSLLPLILRGKLQTMVS